MREAVEVFDLQSYLAGLRTPVWGPFSMEGCTVWANVLAGTVNMQIRVNGQLTTIQMHPDHAMHLARLLHEGAVLQWSAWNTTTKEMQ